MSRAGPGFDAGHYIKQIFGYRVKLKKNKKRNTFLEITDSLTSLC